MGSAVVALGNDFATTEGQILEFSKRIAGASSSAKISTADMFAFSAVMGSLGINAELGGSNFSKAITEIDIAAQTGSKELDLFAKVAGQSSKEFQKAWKEDASGAFQTILEGLNQTENKAQVIQELFGTSSEMQRLFQALSSDGSMQILGEALKTARKEMSGLQEGMSALEIEAEKRFATTSSLAVLMKNKWAAALEPIGSILNDYVVKPLIKFV